MSDARCASAALAAAVLAAIALFAWAPGASAAPAPSTTAEAAGDPVVAAACSSVSYGRRTYIMYRRGVSCAFARRWVRRLHYTKRGPRGWRCASGTGFRTGGGCARGARAFGWHPGD